MKIRVRFDGVSAASHARIRELLHSWCDERLEHLLQNFGFAESELAAVVRKRKRGGQPYSAKLHMHLPPKKVLAAGARADQLDAAMDSALQKLLREAERHVERVRKQRLYKRKARRQRLRELKGRLAELPPELQAERDAGIEALLPRLQRAVRRELIYLRSQGDLPADYPSEQDVLDEVLVAAKVDWHDGADPERLYRRLLRELHRVLDREVGASRRFADMESLEARPAVDAEDQAEKMVGEEIYEFWQPDEVLHLEDIVPDESAALPEEELDERGRYTLRLLGDLPLNWRRALMLHELERIPVGDVADVLQVEATTAQLWIESANRYLEARLADAGFELAGGRPLDGIRLAEQ